MTSAQPRQGEAWIVQERIGTGGTGLIERVSHRSDGSVAAKRSLSSAYVGDQDVLTRFRRGVRLQAELDHPNVLGVLSSDVEVIPPWYVMPLGQPLDELVSGGTDEATVDRIFGGILSGVAYAHDRDVLHRDLKPANVIVIDGEPKISDFGLGRSLTGTSTATTTAMGIGTFLYTSPEQMKDLHAADRRSDVYSLGKVLHHLVTGEPPYIYQDSRITPKYEYFIDRSTRTSPDDRYQNVHEMIAAWEQVLAGIERPEAPRDALTRLVREYDEIPLGEDPRPKLQELHSLFVEHRNNADFYQYALPALPQYMRDAYMSMLSGDFAWTLRTFDAHVSGGLPFDYCDRVADLYSAIYRGTSDVGLKRVLLGRLWEMGAMHNRWYVGQVVAGLLSGAQNPTDVAVAEEVIAGAPHRKEFFVGFTHDVALNNRLRRALEGDAPA